MEQTEFDIILESPGNDRLRVVKAVREITGLGIREAEDLVDNTPKTVKEQMSVADAQEIKKKLEEAGGTVTLK